MKKIKTSRAIIIEGILYSLIPALCTFLGQSDALELLQKNEYIGKSVNINTIKNICFILSIFLTFSILTTKLIISQIRENRFREQRSNFIKFNKEIFVKTLMSEFGKEFENINIRIFVPKKPLVWYIRRIFFKDTPLYFVIRNIEGLANPGLTKNLSFQVTPNKQGLVGDCYNSKQMVFDDDLEHNNKTYYDLSRSQVNKTNELKFSLVCPLFKDNNNNDEIIAIVAFDSTDRILVDSDKKTKILERSIPNYTQQLLDYAPELFKKEGGLL